MAAPVRQHLDRRRPPGPPFPQLGVPGDRHDPHRDRHLVAGQTVRVPLAVPAFVGVSQRVAHRLAQPDPGRQAGPGLAVLRQAAPGHARVGQRPNHPPGAAMGREVLGQVAHEVAHRLARLGHQHRGHRRVERHVVASRQHRGVGGVRGAAEKPQQRHVVHARPRRRIQPERLGRPQRQPARPQPVLHRLTGAEIRRQRQRHRQLRQPTRRAVVSHTTTVPARQPPVDGRTRPGSQRPPVDGPRCEAPTMHECVAPRRRSSWPPWRTSAGPRRRQQSRARWMMR